MKETSHTKLYIIDIHLSEMFRIGKSIETKSRLAVVRRCGKGKQGVTANGYGAFWGERQKCPRIKWW